MTQATYAIICDARRGQELGIDTLAMVDRSKTTKGFWTSDNVPLIMRFINPTVAEKVKGRFHYNNPRVVDYDFALGVIQRQMDSIEEAKIPIENQKWNSVADGENWEGN